MSFNDFKNSILLFIMPIASNHHANKTQIGTSTDSIKKDQLPLVFFFLTSLAVMGWLFVINVGMPLLKLFIHDALNGGMYHVLTNHTHFLPKHAFDFF